MVAFNRHLLALSIIALVSSGLLALPVFDRLRGLSIDLLTGLRWSVTGSLHDASRSPAVVVALDEETYEHRPFSGSPSVTWTREIGQVLTALVAADAAVVGFDIIFPTTIEQSEIPFDGGTLGGKVRGFDRTYLLALAKAAQQDKVVLGQVQHQNNPIVPSGGQRFAVGHQRNIRPLNLFVDPDEIVRRVPLSFIVDEVRIPSLAVELVSRKIGKRPDTTTDGGVRVGEYRIPNNIPNTLTLNFEGGADDVPTYSLADLRACIDKGDTAFFRRHFKDRIVILGALLDTEDRIVTSKRFATGLEGARADRCAIPHATKGSKFRRDSIAGAYVHATAANNILRGDALREVGWLPRWLLSSVLALVTATATMAFSLPMASIAVFCAFVAWTALATIGFVHALVLPFVDALAAGLIAAVATVGYRLTSADRDKRFLRKTFSYYVEPALIDHMMESNRLPQLGGEIRPVTIYCSDVEGFTSLSQGLEPEELVTLMNEYLTAMSSIISQHKGFVDKYFGDAIVAVFGAPVDDPDHALHAVEAALACQAKLIEMNNANLASFKGLELRQRIGLHSGEGLVGNIGSQQRFNYTVMGDVANLASRLEGANKYYGTPILASEATAKSAGNHIFWRELDDIQVVGRSDPVRIYQPLALAAHETELQRAQAAAYAKGLARWRHADFPTAADAFATHAESDPPARQFYERAVNLVDNPPDGTWQPLNVLESK